MNNAPIWKKALTIFIFALIGWGICGAIIGIGRSVVGMDRTLVIHAIVVPIVFGLLSWLYFARFNYTTPLQTAAIFMGLAIFLDASIIAPFSEKSYVMFTSVLGTWIPFASIFASTYLVGWLVNRRVAENAQPRPA